MDQYDNTVCPEFDLDLLVAELPARGTQIFKSVFKKILVELPCNSNFKLKFSCSTRDECNLVYNKNSNNCILANQ